MHTHSTGILLEDGRQAMLYEAHPITEPVEPGALRAVEAMHHTSLLVALHETDGTAVFRNPAAVRVLGSIESAPADAWLAMFEDEEVGRSARQCVLRGQTYSERIRLRT